MDNKRKLLYSAAVLLAALVLATGASYAWFLTGGGATATAEMGRLSVTTVADPGNPDYSNLEPGTEVQWRGVITNTGQIPAVVSVEQAVAVTIRSDDRGAALPEAEWYVLEDDPNLGLSIDPSSLGYRPGGQAAGPAVWAYHGASDSYFLFLGVGASADVGLTLTLDGPGMGNRYMNAGITFAQDWRATQMLHGALAGVYGIGYDELAFYDHQLGEDDSGTLETTLQAIETLLER